MLIEKGGVTMGKTKVVDIHVHIGGTGDSGSGCKMSPEFIISPAFAFMLLSLGATPADICDEKIRKIILDIINTSQQIDYVVLLALDYVFKDEKKIENNSHLVVPNKYIVKIKNSNPKVLFGASVHPYREKKDMIKEMNYCIKNGAVLFKWIPSSQQIDPKDKKCFPFYEKLFEEAIPLLCHTGPEHAVPTSNFDAKKYNDPKRLKNALKLGVKVIAAHCAAPYFTGYLEEDYFDVLMDMLKKYENLYTDISAFCVPTRIKYLERIIKEIEQESINSDKFLFGSDFPIPIIDINKFKLSGICFDLFQSEKSKGNPLDNNYTILKEFGLPDSIFTNASKIIKLPD